MLALPKMCGLWLKVTRLSKDVGLEKSGVIMMIDLVGRAQVISHAQNNEKIHPRIVNCYPVISCRALLSR